jgi:lysophospholipase L1-like esterase
VGDSQGGFFRRLGTATIASRYEALVNLGVAGDTTRKMLDRADIVAAHAPGDIVVLLGCNDVPRAEDRNPTIRTSISEYERIVQALLAKIRMRHSLFVSSFPVCEERTGVSVDVLSEYMDTALGVARSLGYAVWDLRGELQAPDLERFWAPDGLHFNDAGHEWIANGVASRLELWR